MSKKIKIEIELKDSLKKSKKKDKSGKAVRLGDFGDYCITETTGIGGRKENTFIMRLGEIEEVNVKC